MTAVNILLDDPTITIKATNEPFSLIVEGLIKGGGDVVGPESATDNSIALYNGTTGKIIKSDPTLNYTAGILNATSIAVSGLNTEALFNDNGLISASSNLLIGSTTINIKNQLVISDTNSSSKFLVLADAPGGPVFVVSTTTERVGINIFTPQEALDVVGNIKVSGTISAPGADKELVFNSSGVLAASDDFIINGISVISKLATLTLGVAAAVKSAVFVDGTTEPVFVVDTTTKRVGINKFSPSEALDVVGNVIVSGQITGGSITAPGANQQIIFNDNGVLNSASNLSFSGTSFIMTTGQNLINGADSALKFGVFPDTGTLPVMLMVNTITERVGIGTITPTELLDVAGNIKLTGNIIVDGTVDTRDIAVDGTKLDGISAGAQTQTPWIGAIDADGFDLNDISNIQFRPTIAVPSISSYAFYQGTSRLIANVPTGSLHQLNINGVAEYTFDEVEFNLKGNSLANVGTVDGRNISIDGIKLDGIESLADVTLSTLATATVSIDMNGQKVVNIGTPILATDSATKGYVDSVASGLDWKDSARLTTTANITLSGEQTIDGVLTSGDRVLVKNQSTASENGIYVSAAGTWARSTDADTDAQVTAGLAIFIEEGSTQSDSGWVLTTNDPITLDTTPLVFTQFTSLGQVTAGDGLVKTGSTLDVVANADGSMLANGNDIQVGILATDAQHGLRGGGTQHSNVIAAGASGFMTGADKTKLDGIEVNAKIGDVVGPGGATDNAVVRFDLASGELIQNSGVIIDDSNNILVPGDYLSDSQNNTKIGTAALALVTTGTVNAALGENALAAVTTGSNNVAIGHNAAPNITTGSFNVAIGQNALTVATTVSEMVAIGNNALFINSSGVRNTAIGHGSQTGTETTNDNTSVGYIALNDNALGSGNTGIGSKALSTNSTGNNNVAVGLETMSTGDDTSNNAVLGAQALKINGTNDNTAIGFQALVASFGGANNTALGSGAGALITTGANNILIGKDADTSSPTASNETVIGNALITSTTLAGSLSGVRDLVIEANHAVQLSGTVSVTINTNVVVGVGTKFITELQIGDIVEIANVTFQVLTISDDLNLTLNNDHSAGASTVSIFTDPNLLVVSTQDAGLRFLVDKSGDVYSAGLSWKMRTAASNNSWRGVAYGNGTFVAVSNNGTGNRVMTSSDGVLWTSRTSAADNKWRAVVFGNGIFVAVAEDGLGSNVMTSIDGITWTLQTSPDNKWQGLTYGKGLFVAVAFGGFDRVMTSPDGVNWTSQITPTFNFWTSVAYGNNIFVVVGNAGTGLVMTSSDAITWTIGTPSSDSGWLSVVFAQDLFVAVANSGTDRIMTSPDGVTWTARTPAETNSWQVVAYGDGLFISTSATGTNRVMTSTDGIKWTSRSAASNSLWNAIVYANGLFVSVAQNSALPTGIDRVMVSGKTDTLDTWSGNSFQGGLDLFGDINVNGKPAAVTVTNQVVISKDSEWPTTFVADTHYLITAPITVTTGSTIDNAAKITIESTDRINNTVTYTGTTGTLFTATAMTGSLHFLKVKFFGNGGTSRLFNLVGSGFPDLFMDSCDIRNWGAVSILDTFGGGIAIGKIGGGGNADGVFSIINSVFFGVENSFFQNFSDTNSNFFTIDALTSRVAMVLTGVVAQPNENVFKIDAGFTGEVIINTEFGTPAGQLFDAAGLDGTSIFVDVNNASNQPDSTTSAELFLTGNTAVTDIPLAGALVEINVNVNWTDAVEQMTITTDGVATLDSLSPEKLGYSGNINLEPSTATKSLSIRTVSLVSASNTVTFTSGTDLINETATPRVDGDTISFRDTVGTLPAEIRKDIVYFIVSQTTNSFQVAYTSGGAAIAFTDNGTPTNSYKTAVLHGATPKNTITAANPRDLIPQATIPMDTNSKAFLVIINNDDAVDILVNDGYQKYT